MTSVPLPHRPPACLHFASLSAPALASNHTAGRIAAAGFLGLMLPGAGHALLGRRREMALFFVPILLMLAGLAGLYAGGGLTAILAFAVTPGVLPLLAVVNIALAIWRVAAGFDAVRRSTRKQLALAVLGPASLLLVVVPHVWLGSTIAATDDFLNSMFASGPEPSEAAYGNEPEETIPPGWTLPPYDQWVTFPPTSAGPEESLAPGATPRPPRGPMGSGDGSLPGLGVSVPWDRPGAVPWGDDGRFDLLLLGSDAGPYRWSRRMDVMLLVEVDVSSGKTAMVGLPRNLQNTPLPPGPARDAVACGCFSDLFNALYVEATFRHPDRWPGTGAVQGIGAVRSVVSELTGRPVDAVLVADLWGVIKVVDAMGGIDIDVPSAVYDAHYPDPVVGPMELYIPAGDQHLDGRLALAYARSRHSGSDYTRMARQQTLLVAIREQIGADTILNAPELFAAAKGFAWTDLPRDSLPNLVTLFGTAQNASVKHLRIVPPTYPSWLTGSEITKIRTDIAKLLGVPVPPTPTPTAVPTPTAGASSAPSPAPTPSHTPAPTESPPPESPAPT